MEVTHDPDTYPEDQMGPAMNEPKRQKKDKGIGKKTKESGSETCEQTSTSQTEYSEPRPSTSFEVALEIVSEEVPVVASNESSRFDPNLNELSLDEREPSPPLPFLYPAYKHVPKPMKKIVPIKRLSRSPGGSSILSAFSSSNWRALAASERRYESKPEELTVSSSTDSQYQEEAAGISPMARQKQLEQEYSCSSYVTFEDYNMDDESDG